MKQPTSFLGAANLPTLGSSFLYFACCNAVWAVNGVMAPFIKETFHLLPQQVALLISVPIMAGAFLRFPMGLAAQNVGRKMTAMLEMGGILAVAIYGYYFASSFGQVIVMGVLLGLAGASFGVAVSLGGGWYPARHKGLAMGLVGAGNTGTALAALAAPLLAARFGWQRVYGFAGLLMVLPFLAVLLYAKEPPDRRETLFPDENTRCLWEADGWVFSAIYIVTFGGFIGLSAFVPIYYAEQFHVPKLHAGQLVVWGALLAGVIRIAGGYLADRFGGITTLSGALAALIVCMLAAAFAPGMAAATALLLGCYAALGVGSGALFQLVPQRWPATTAVAGSMIGEVGALGAALLPLAMAYSRVHTGGYQGGFLVFAALAGLALTGLRTIQGKWVRQWAGPGGRAREEETATVGNTDVPVKNFHLLIDGEQRGPFNRPEVKEKLSRGDLTADSLYWEEGTPE